MNGRTLPFAVVLSAVVVASACSGKYVTDFGPPDEGAPDAATVDGAIDVNASDAGTDDAQLPSSPCAVAHSFCDDFDNRSTDAGAGWDSLDLRAGPLSIEKGTAVSASQSLRASLQGKLSVVGSELRKTVALAANATSATVEFDFRADLPTKPWASTEIYAAMVAVTPPPAGAKVLHFGITLTSDGERFVYYGEVTSGTVLFESRPIQLRYNAWQHLRISLELGAGRVQAKLSSEGNDLGTLSYSGGPVSNLTLAIGAPFVRESNLTGSLGFDNVVLDSK